jgi:hypothetical protein
MIIPVFRVVTTQFPIAAGTEFQPGWVVALDQDTGKAVPCTPSNSKKAIPIGLSADRNKAAQAYEWVNRISDMGNDTAGSRMISVYQMGEFYVDVDDGAITTPSGTTIAGVIASSATVKPGSYLYAIDGGKMDASTTANPKVGVVLEAEVSSVTGLTTGEGEALESGIPGEYAPGSSVAYVDDNVPRTWAKIKLLV